jgi:hypothetical protein
VTGLAQVLAIGMARAGMGKSRTLTKAKIGKRKARNRFGLKATCRTYGAQIVVVGYPALTRWANLCRAYGAGWEEAQRSDSCAK